jgi:glycosyltransferase involved in cell wall biosynthesis
MTAPAVTIGLPVYNGAALVRRAIDSVLMQDFRDFELIISDNGSTDATAAIAAEYAAADPRVRYVRQEKPLDPRDNFKYVLTAARGEMFSWLAHDDCYATPDHIRRLAEKIGEGKTFAFPGVHVVHLYADGSTSREERDMFAGFANLRTRGQLIRQAIRQPSAQIYGLFRTETMRKYFPLLLEDRDLICYFEGRLVQTLLLQEPWAFVPEVALNLGQSAAQYTNSLDPAPLLRDFLRYSKRTMAMYRRSPKIRRGDRPSVYFELMRSHGFHAARLLGSVLKKNIANRITRKSRG